MSDSGPMLKRGQESRNFSAHIPGPVDAITHRLTPIKSEDVPAVLARLAGGPVRARREEIVGGVLRVYYEQSESDNEGDLPEPSQVALFEGF